MKYPFNCVHVFSHWCDAAPLNMAHVEAVSLNPGVGGGTVSAQEKALAQRQQLSAFCETSYRCLSHAHAGVKEQV